jgi:cell division protein FtsL
LNSKTSVPKARLKTLILQCLFTINSHCIVIAANVIIFAILILTSNVQYRTYTAQEQRAHNKMKG